MDGREGAGQKGGRMEEGRMERRGGRKRTGRKGQEEGGAGRKDGLQRVEPLITIGGVVVIHSSVRRWLRSFVRHCTLIAVDGVVVVV